MNHGIDDALLRDYLAQLQTKLTLGFADHTEEILYGVRDHMADALERGLAAPEIIAGLGSPDEIAAGSTMLSAGMPRAVLPPAPGKTESYRDSTLWLITTCILLPFGAFLAGIGWLFGVAGLWMGTRWKLWEKIMGTVILPGGLLGSSWLVFMTGPLAGIESGGPVEGVVINGSWQATPPEPVVPMLPIVLSVAAFALPIAVALYLLVVGLRRGSSSGTKGMRHN